MDIAFDFHNHSILPSVFLQSDPRSFQLGYSPCVSFEHPFTVNAIPDCNMYTFQDDLRLREAYRLLQSTSHIRLPRLCADGTGSGSSPFGNGSAGAEGSRFTEPRLEMHLAAAGIRVWASAVGRGMLGLDSLSGFRIPTQLRVQPVCLRGRAVSPSSGRRVLVDLARESLTTLNVNNTNQGRNVAGVLDGPLDPNDRRTVTGIPGLISSGSDANGPSVSDELSDASNHPGNSMALAVASAVAASGAAAALRVRNVLRCVKVVLLSPV